MAVPSPSGLLAFPAKGNYFDDAAHSVNSRYNRGLNGGFKGANAYADGIVNSSNYYALLAGYEVTGGSMAEVSSISTNRGPVSNTSITVLGIFPTKEGIVGYRNRTQKEVDDG